MNGLFPGSRWPLREPPLTVLLCFSERVHENLVTSAQWEVFLSHHQGALQQLRCQRRPQQVPDVPKAAVSIAHAAILSVQPVLSYSDEAALGRLCLTLQCQTVVLGQTDQFVAPQHTCELSSALQLVTQR